MVEDKGKVEEKSIVELGIELEGLATIPEDYKQATEYVKDQVTELPQNDTVALPAPTEVAVGAPKIEQPAPQTPTPAVEAVKAPFSLDSILKASVDREKQLIDADAETKKRMVEERVYGKLGAFVEAITAGKDLATQVAPVKPEVVIKEVPVEVKVKDNSEALKLLSEAIEDPKIKHKRVLMRIRDELGGTTSTSPTPEVIKEFVVKEPKPPMSKKLLLAAFGLAGLATLAVIILLIALEAH